MKEKILDVLRTNYPDKYEELHEVTANVLVLVLQSQLEKEKYKRLNSIFLSQYFRDENKKLQSQLKKEREDLKLPIEFIKHITGIKQKRTINTKWKEWLTSNPKYMKAETKLFNQFAKEKREGKIEKYQCFPEWTANKILYLESQLKGFKFCPHCGDKLQHQISTDASTDKVCKSVLCKTSNNK